VALLKDQSLKKMTTKQLFAITTASIMLLPSLCLGAVNYLSLPEGFGASVLEYGSQLFTDLSLLIILAVGLPVGFWIIRKVISLVRVR
jgi:hypothetical protein